MSEAGLVAAIQLNSGDDVAANLQATAEQLELAAAAGAGLVVLPENFAAMPRDEQQRRELAEDDGDGPIQSALANLARRHACWLVAGTLPLRVPEDQRPAAACCVYNAAGERVARYDKMHLFDVQIPGAEEAYRESANTVPGNACVSVPTPWGKLGLSVCYDLRFPELYRQLAAQDVSIFVVPAAFTRPTGKAHWDVLLRARAIENLSYVVAAAQCGEHPGGRLTWGHSLVVGPWGERLAEAGSEPGYIIAALEPERCQRLRREFPSLSQRRYTIKPLAPASPIEN